MGQDFGPDWLETRRLVIQRAMGVCERCQKKAGKYVHHLKYWPKKKGKRRPRGGEPLEWLQYVCGPCHQLYHPNKPVWGGDPTLKPTPRPRPKIRKVKRHRNCEHCGGKYTKAQHRAICVRFGLAHPPKKD